MKICTKCRVEKPLSAYSKRGEGEKLRSACNDCQAAYHQKWKNGNPEHARAKWNEASKRYYSSHPRNEKANLKRRLIRHGLEESEFWRMHEAQNGRCKICRKEEKDVSQGHLYIDHCHSTGKVRGLLCSHCNTAIGMFEDREDLLLSAIAYLRDTQS